MEERLKDKNMDTTSVKPENTKNEAIKQEIYENEQDILNKKFLQQSDIEDDNMELSFLANQSYSDLL